MNMRKPLQLFAALMWLAAPAIAADVRGAQVDDSKSFEAAPGHDTEFNTPLEGLPGYSNLWETDLKAMRESAATLPATPPTREVALVEADRNTLFTSGWETLLQDARAQLDRIAGGVAGKPKLRFLVVGHADTQHLSANARKRYRDNQGLSEARAFQVAQYLRGKLGLPAEVFTIRGEGDRKPVADNATPAGMAKNRRVEISVWYTEEHPAPPAVAAAATEKVGCGAAGTAGAVAAAGPASATGAGGVPFSITVDGQPATAQDGVVEADHQRCVDVAAERHDLQIQFDPLKTEPALNVSVWPNGVAAGQPVEFDTYSNYLAFIKRAELRFFVPAQDSRQKPFLVLPVTLGQPLRWTPDASMPAESTFVLRVYDARGRFDETVRKRLSILDHPRIVGDGEAAARERLVGYGESTLRVHNIPVTGGSVTVSGRNVQKGERVTIFGADVPVDPQGRFVTRQLLPSGTHQVEVQTELASGEKTHFARNLTLGKDAWFYVALGEFTVADNHTTGPAELVTGDTERYSKRTEITGRGAFYAKGKVHDDYLVTLSADTRERPIEDLFSNFTSKDPRFLLERIDADRAYPVYGDDSTSEWDAPTNGRAYARVEHHDSRAVWGNFQTTWTGLELNQYSRSLYGGELYLKSDAATGFGERRGMADLFAAEPGTLNSREEFRGTGGSLYYLHRQDISRGSERLWIEIRDFVSGVPVSRTQLVPGLDYELSYLQGRILLRAPLPSVADNSSLVQAGSLSGNPVYLVSTYEYTPGLSSVTSNVYGGRISAWADDHVRLGFSGYQQGDGTDRQRLGGADATLRYAAGTFLDMEWARSDGAANALSSIDGGFGFNQSSISSDRANAARFNGVFDLSEVWENARGRGNVYWQKRDAGFSGPGAFTPGEAVLQRGAALSVPVAARVSVDMKVDERDATTQSVNAEEAAVHLQLNPRWGVSVGGRHDDRRSDVALASSLLSQNGERTDAVVRVDYKPESKEDQAALSQSGMAQAKAPVSTNKFDVTRATVPAEAAAETAARPAPWRAYAFGQGTLDRSGDRDRNDRGGVGGEVQVNDRVRLGAEASEGSGGFGGLASADYRISDRSNIYLTHTMETERPDSNYRGRYDNTVLGSRVQIAEHVSVYDEARNARGAGPDSLTNAFGVDLSPNDRWTYGLKFEAGTVSDPLAGDLTRKAAAIGVGYKLDRTRFTSNLEYRHEDGTAGLRKTWLSRNTGAYQFSSDWRLIGKFNFSFSQASAGNFYDGDFIDASMGTAYRPVANDRWNTLLQYRYYYTLPSPGQVNLSDDLLDYAQRSHVLSADTIYDVNPWLSVGGKIGERIGSLRNSRIGGPWYSSRADLGILRADVHFVREWDILIELRQLKVYEADDRRSGVLAAIYRHFGEHVKLGAGYNFTDFSDDLTDLSFRSAGPFINILGIY